jgi:phospholipase/lecithinase/hemolysin
MKRIKNFTRLILGSAIVAILVGCGEGSGGRFTYSDFIVFGASLSDTGNVYTATNGSDPGSSPSYYLGRWSNGPLWIDNVAQSYGKEIKAALLGGTNYAYGGAKTCATVARTSTSVPDICDQVDQYLLSVSNKANPNALYVIDASAVGNEITEVLSGTTTSAQITTAAPTNVTDKLQALYSAGARRFLVTNVPDVGSTPLIQSYGASAAATATSLSRAFNVALDNALNSFVSANPNAVLYKADFYGTLAKVKTSPSTYGISNIADACQIGGIICSSPDSYLYWDDFHPTKTIGSIVSSYVLGLI